ncbi:maltokinase N-terminal cap-like domain-containing protein [Stigmatella aurantiaca]|uniref:Maltokinase n=1 Tax=Stigmatella aurantiaca (strain DW4/3-1) TaxID=378806 RepID=Q08TR8_STIAD|nr:phosphotransferase [Stigmatella aurantiaca]ADO71951.1 sugar phosphotransferase [Stigmatella aurantiaca DW4/3-1]EAU63866.1 trehalose synthase [Stigmatella aurantiaca DW4/3-1]
MTPVDLTKLPEYLKHQRWFAGKAWPIKSVSVVDHVTLDSGSCAFSLAVVEVVYELGQPERYLLPVKPSSEGIQDALEEADCLRNLFQIIREQRTVPSSSGQVQGEWLSTPDGLVALPDPLPVRRLTVEQSNTSVVFGEKVILKIIRKLEAGVNPEHEMGRFLATRTSFRSTPMLLGALSLSGNAGATLALVHRFVPNATDGWKYTLEQFRRSGELPAPFLEEMRELGRRIGELHHALASVTDDPAFAPEPLLQEDLQRWSASILGEMGKTLADASRVHVDIDNQRERLMEHARRLAHVTPSGQKIRIHGDLHLGQVLRSENQWLIFDFEGEPSRNFTQRREKYSPMRDVAGMLRSFDYAEATVMLEGNSPGPRLAPCRQAFLEGYREITRGAAFLPADEASFWTMLRAFELEKLLYEVRYELQNRPDWVRIPVQALLRMEEPT